MLASSIEVIDLFPQESSVCFSGCVKKRPRLNDPAAEVHTDPLSAPFVNSELPSEIFRNMTNVFSAANAAIQPQCKKLLAISSPKTKGFVFGRTQTRKVNKPR